jgi:alkyl hydroperoxide reductase subunit AhpC
MTIRIGFPAPNVVTDAWVRGDLTPNRVSLGDYRGRWIVLVFYPRDFTFVCPTELMAFAALQAELDAEGATLLAASTDSFWSHRAWFEGEPRLASVMYPVLADTSHELAREFGVLRDDGAALRGTFIIDPNGIVRHLLVNDLDIGRNPEETLRTLQALRTGELCPVGWQPGDGTLGTGVVRPNKAA